MDLPAPHPASHEAPRLLLVEDDPTVCAVLARALERRGYRVSVAHDCQAALHRAGREQPGYAVVDLKSAGVAGLQLVQRLASLPVAPRVVVLAAAGGIGRAVQAVKLGAHTLLTKPATADDIVAAFARAPAGAPQSPSRERPLPLHRLEWEHIQRVLGENGGNVSATARSLGMHRRTLQRKLARARQGDAR